MRSRRLLVLSLLAVALLMAGGLAGAHRAKAGQDVAASHSFKAGPPDAAPAAGQITRASQDRHAVRAAKKTIYVYITNTGTKYHRNGCRYLAHSKIKKTLKWVKAHGYKPCKVCKPPT